MSRPVRNLRLFAAIYPPAEIAVRLHAIASSIEVDGRLTPAEQLHITAQFIGDVPVNDLDDVIESVRRSCAGLHAFPLTVETLNALPERPPHRLVAAETDTPGDFGELHSRLVTRLAHGGRSGKPFRPHFTLVRLNRPGRVDLDGVALPDEPIELDVEQVHLMRSTLSHMGAEHHVVEEVELG